MNTALISLVAVAFILVVGAIAYVAFFLFALLMKILCGATVRCVPWILSVVALIGVAAYVALIGVAAYQLTNDAKFQAVARSRASIPVTCVGVAP